MEADGPKSTSHSNLSQIHVGINFCATFVQNLSWSCTTDPLRTWISQEAEVDILPVEK